MFFYVSWWVVCHHLLNLLHDEQTQFCLRASLESKQWLTRTICLFVTTSLCTNILTEYFRAPNRMQNFLWCLFHSLTISWQVTKYVSKWVIQPIHSFNFFSSIFIYFILLRKTFKETTSVQIHFLCSLIPSIASENEDYKSGKYSTSWTEVQHIFSVCLFGNI